MQIAALFLFTKTSILYQICAKHTQLKLSINNKNYCPQYGRCFCNTVAKWNWNHLLRKNNLKSIAFICACLIGFSFLDLFFLIVLGREHFSNKFFIWIQIEDSEAAIVANIAFSFWFSSFLYLCCFICDVFVAPILSLFVFFFLHCYNCC